MAFFIRFTDTPEEDLKRGISYHSTGIEKSSVTDDCGNRLSSKKEKAHVADLLECDVSDVKVISGYYVQALPGLCAFELDADNTEEAIEEACTFSYGFFNAASESYCILEGEYVCDCPEGVVIRPKNIVFRRSY